MQESLKCAEVKEVVNKISAVTYSPDIAKRCAFHCSDKPSLLTVEDLEKQNSNEHGTQLAKLRPELWPGAENGGQCHVQPEDRNLSAAADEPIGCRPTPHKA